MGLNDTGKNISSTTLQNSFTNHSKLRIIASFYPIYYFIKEIGGVRVDIETLIPIGVEPHDFEPTIQQIQNAESADMFVYNGIGLEKWIDKINSKIKIDASRGFNPITNNKTKIIGANDPHVWLDPILAMKEVEIIRDALVKVDPSNSKYYQTNSNKLVLVTMSLIYKKLTYVKFDEEQAAVGGLRVRNINYMFIVIASVTVIASIRLVGVLLISSLIVLPNITALAMGKGFKKTAIISCGISICSVIIGIIVSYFANIAPSGAVVLTEAAIFLIALSGRFMINKNRRTKLKIESTTESRK